MRSVQTPLEELLGLEPGDDIAPEAQRLEASLLPLQQLSDVTPSPELWNQIVEKVNQDDHAPGTKTIAQDEGVWENMFKGIERKIVHLDPKAKSHCYFVRMRAGAVLPVHSHDTDEHCVVLEGELEIGGNVFGAGTYHFAQQDISHVPITARTDALFFIHGAL